MPAQAYVHEFSRAEVLHVMFHQIETSTEMIALGRQHNSADARLRDRGEQRHQFFNGLRIQGIALVGPVQGRDQNAILM
jgi:hypothetical protein